MAESRFDAWTRRRFGLAVAGVIALERLLRDPLQTTSKNNTGKKKRRRKRCRQPGHTCVPGSKRTCCKGSLCGPNHGVAGSFCCQGEGGACTTSSQCCIAFACHIEVGSDVGVCAVL